MKTELVYLTDSYLKEIEAKVLEIEIVNKKLAKLILDKTIFYPEGGGQSSDHGRIVIKDKNFTVKQVRLENEEIKHYVELKENLPEKTTCFLEIDWKRRYKNMQIHTAGHIIDWALSELKLHNDKITPHKANHKKKPCLIYLGKSKSIEKSDLQKRVNKILKNNLKITTEFISYEELREKALYVFPNLPKDKPLRMVTLEGYKGVPDGGTLIKKTGEIYSIILQDIKVTKYSTEIYYNVEETKTSLTKMTITNHKKISKNLASIQKEALKEIDKLTTMPMLEKLRIKYLGRKAKFVQILRTLKNLPYDIRAEIGRQANELKQEIILKLDEKEIELKKIIQNESLEKEWIDVTEPGISPEVGHIHPITQMLWRATDIFESMGFEIIEPPEIDTDYNHFTAVNIPVNHPARDMWDTIWTEDGQIAIAHTSTMQNRILSQLEPPIRAIVPGRCFRNEATDSSHEHTFYQIEGVYLDKGITLAHLISTLKIFLEAFMDKKLRIKIQPSYFPFVEPALEIMMERPGYKKIKLENEYDKKEWLEVIPCGPIHPNVLKEAGKDPNVYTGFAWGFGLDRLTMVKYGIDDIRYYHSGDLRFLKQF